MITSTANPKVKYIRSLYEHPSRQRDGCFVIEGIRLMEEALGAGIRPKMVLFNSTLLGRTSRGRRLLAGLAGHTAEEVSERVLECAAETVTPQGALAVLPIPKPSLGPLAGNPVLVIDGLQDPGNLGTILRSAWASGAKTVLFASGTVDPYGPKVVRSAMGAHFHLDVRPRMTWEDIARALAGWRVLLADPQGNTPYYDVDWNLPSVLIIGSEAQGASREARRLAQIRVFIPMEATTESLNAAVACSLMLFEAQRQRQARGGGLPGYFDSV